MEDLLVPIAFFAAVVLTVYFVVHANLKRLRMEHEERMLAIERGTPLPPKPERKIRNPYKWPVILIALGVAIIFALLMEGDDDWPWGLLPFLIGFGMILSHRHLMRERRQHNAALEMPPYSQSVADKQPGAE